jgi:hypothetical protein
MEIGFATAGHVEPGRERGAAARTRAIDHAAAVVVVAVGMRVVADEERDAHRVLR